MKKRLVIIESPYAGDREGNYEYWKSCMTDSIMRGEAPFSSHFFYTQLMDDTKPHERILGIDFGFQWQRVADVTVFYVDKGLSKGMQESLTRCLALGIPHEIRRLT